MSLQRYVQGTYALPTREGLHYVKANFTLPSGLGCASCGQKRVRAKLGSLGQTAVQTSATSGYVSGFGTVDLTLTTITQLGSMMQSINTNLQTIEAYMATDSAFAAQYGAQVTALQNRFTSAASTYTFWYDFFTGHAPAGFSGLGQAAVGMGTIVSLIAFIVLVVGIAVSVSAVMGYLRSAQATATAQANAAPAVAATQVKQTAACSQAYAAAIAAGATAAQAQIAMGPACQPTGFNWAQLAPYAPLLAVAGAAAIYFFSEEGD